MNPEKERPRLSIGILGCRGVPNRYGGYEQFAEHLSRELVRRGHRVIVYQSGRHPYRENVWEGVTLVRRPDPESWMGSFGQFVYDGYCLRDARRRDFDVLLQLGYTSSAIWSRFWPRQPVNIIHMDGLEWQRSKYSRPVQRFLRRMEGVAARRGDWLVADSPAMETYLRETYHRKSVFIPYGATPADATSEDELDAFGLRPGQYLLAISRLVPENQLEPIIRGRLAARTREPLVIVGTTDTRFGRQLLRRYGGSGVIFTGGIFDKKTLDSLRRHSRLYFHGHSVGGTNPSLLEAMACGARVCAHDNPFNRAVLGDDARYFRTAGEVAALVEKPGGAFPWETWEKRNEEKIRQHYTWTGVIDAYEHLFYRAQARRTRTDR